MIISCEKCKKKFEVDDNLIPKSGRLLQCGSCSHKWHYKPIQKTETINELKDTEETKPQEKKIKKKIEVSIKSIKPIIKEKDDDENFSKIKIKKISYLNYFLALIISFIALVIFVDTFEFQLTNIIPEINLYLDSLYETLKDIFLFFKDLL